MCEVRKTPEFQRWLDGLKDAKAYPRIETRIFRLALGLPGDVKPVGKGILEMRIDYGPGYRVHFCRRGRALIILLAGGDKHSQQKDIRIAMNWPAPSEEESMEPTRRQTPSAGRAPVRPARTVTTPYDAAENLITGERMAALLEAALEDGHPQVIAAALGSIARAKGMSSLARETGLNPKSLYRALSAEGNPELQTFIKVVHALGLRLHASVAG